MGKIIGIDLGTYKSCAAIFENGQANIIENSQGSRVTPSIITFASDGDILKALNTFSSIKRLIGRNLKESFIKDMMKMVPYEIAPTLNGDIKLACKGKTISLTAVFSKILKSIKEDAEAKFLGEKINRAVVVVPAHFNSSQRQAIITAGRLAGLEIKRLINSTSAIALSWLLDHRINFSYTNESKIFAVYDLGAGFFEFSIIKISRVDGEFLLETLTTEGDSSLGGDDFDLRIYEFIKNEIKTQYCVTLDFTPSSLLLLKDEIQRAKMELSAVAQTEIFLPSALISNHPDQKYLCLKLTTKILEELVSDLILKTKTLCLKAIDNIGLSVSEIENVILVGGQARMPEIRNAVKSIFGKEPFTKINPVESAALGAAVCGGIIDHKITDILFLESCPLSIGIETASGVMVELMEKNSTKPTLKSEVFSISDPQSALKTINVLQGNWHIPGTMKTLGVLNFSEFQTVAKDSSNVYLNFDLDLSGILTVWTTDNTTGKKQTLALTPTGVESSDDEEEYIPEKSTKVVNADSVDAFTSEEINSVTSESRDSERQNDPARDERRDTKTRTGRYGENYQPYELERFFDELRPAIESLERKFQEEQAVDGQKFREGNELIMKQFEKAFAKFGICVVNPVGSPVNYNFHQCIREEPSAKVPPKTVLKVISRGYTLHGRLLHPAMVIVSKPMENNQYANESQEAETDNQSIHT